MDKVEIWAGIPSTNFNYEASSHGNIRRATKAMGTYVGKQLKPARNKQGYAYVNIARKSKFVHRLVLEAFEGRCPDGLEVNHINGLKDDNRRNNLEYVTKSQNAIHAHYSLNAHDMRGEKHPNAKLTTANVLEIRTGNKRVSDLAKEFNVSPSTISMVKTGRNWK